MSDQATALPIRTEDDIQERVQVKIVDYLNPGTGLSADQQMIVDLDHNAHVEIHGNDEAGIDRIALMDTDGRLRVVVEDLSTDNPPTHDPHVGSAIATSATSDHDLTAVAAAKVFKLKQITASASGKLKIEVLVGAPASLVSKFVFFNSVADPNIKFMLAEPIDVPATHIVRIQKTNLEKNDAQDLYSTIIGNTVNAAVA